MIKTVFVTFLLGITFFPSPLWAENEVQDAYTGVNVRREVTDTNSLFNVLRGIYRPNYNKPSQTATQAPYQRIPPPKWRYYGTKPQEPEKEKKTSAVDGHYYKKKAPESEKEKGRSSSPVTPHSP